MKLLCLTVLFIFSACGLKIKEEVNENVLLGKWSLDKIICYEDTQGDLLKEEYKISTIAKIDFEFSTENKLTYTSVGECSTSSYGKYSTSFNGSSTGVVNLKEIITGGQSCEERVSDTGPGVVGTELIFTSLVPSFSESLKWKVSNDKKILILDYHGNFKGSDKATSCDDKCYCLSFYSKESEE